MTARAPRERPGLAALWYGFLGPPIVWAVKFMIAYALVPGACSGGLIFLHALTLVALGATVLAGIVAARSLRRAAGERRARFMAMAGLFSSALFTAVLIAEGLASVLVDPCLGSGAPL